MGLRLITQVEYGSCDGCGADLCRMQEISRDRDPIKVADYGHLRSNFGYGSKRDDCGERRDWHLCGECWDKALEAVGIKRK